MPRPWSGGNPPPILGFKTRLQPETEVSMSGHHLLKLALLAVAAVSLPAIALAGSGPSTVPGTWRALAREPVALPYGASVWTGSKLIVFGRRPLTSTTYDPSVNAAISFDPAANAWKTL